MKLGALNCSSRPTRVSRETAVKGTLTMPSPPWSSLYMATMVEPTLRFQRTSPDLRSSVTSLPVELSAKWATSGRPNMCFFSVLSIHAFVDKRRQFKNLTDRLNETIINHQVRITIRKRWMTGRCPWGAICLGRQQPCHPFLRSLHATTTPHRAGDTGAVQWQWCIGSKALAPDTHASRSLLFTCGSRRYSDSEFHLNPLNEFLYAKTGQYSYINCCELAETLNKGYIFQIQAQNWHSRPLSRPKGQNSKFVITTKFWLFWRCSKFGCSDKVPNLVVLTNL